MHACTLQESCSSLTAQTGALLRSCCAAPHDANCLCRACFDGDAAELTAVLAQQPVDDMVRHDVHGLTPLHIAAMRDHANCVEALLKAGFPATKKSLGGWLAFEEGLCYSSLNAATILFQEHERILKARIKERLHQLKETFAGMPDAALQVRCGPACKCTFAYTVAQLLFSENLRFAP